jgi:dCTP deaminase
LCKSTYIRAGILIPTTVLEAGWEGIITLEITNVTPLPAKVYANEGIAQILFFEGDELCDTSYADRKGKYQNQQGVVLPRV